MLSDSPATPGGTKLVKESDIIKAFQTINEDLQNKPDLVDKCLSICHQFSVAAADLAYEWEAHALNGPTGDSSQTLLTLSSLEALEAALSKKRAAAQHSSALSSRKLTTPLPPRSATAFNSNSLPASEKDLRKRLSMDGASEGGLMSPPPSDLKRPLPSNGTFLSPSEPGKMARAGDVDISPATMQSPSEPGSCYKGRGNAGQRAMELNAKLGQRGTFTPSKRRGGSRCELTFLEEGQDINLTQRYRYMYTTLDERARALEKGLVWLEKEMVDRADLEGMALTPVGVPRQEPVLVCGRVCCEAAEGRLNKSSVLLEGSRRDSGGFRVKLELDNLASFALFPGQVITVEGINSSGFKMVVRRVCEGIPRPLSQTRVSKMRQYHHDLIYQGGEPLSILLAAGPYTTVDSLEYAPLEDLLRVVAAKKPDVAVLCGPFIDASHPSIASGEAEVVGDESEGEIVDFEALFKMRVSYFLDGLFASHPNLPTKIVLVPSLSDVFHDNVFPQPPLADRIPGGVPSPFFEEERIGNLDIPYSTPGSSDQRVWCLSNPAMFKINETVVGVTTNDILFHLSGEEVSQGQSMNRLSRLAGHLIQQQSFYPLFPPPADGQAQLDLRHADHWKMHVTPDVLLLPSKLHHFAKEVGGCLCVNPGPLAKGAVGGTYACLDIHPMPAESLDMMDQDIELEHKVAARTAVEIFKI